ncbi:type IV secretory system conjugative DNA transfer family protein [Kordiimonas pumila]|uniref:Type IV secretory system conjugative DNA transfer family protein n=1 Tax=Kordiimonas pumila TaxID=2161677 RepID=A0ABV7D8F3_9PROT|nr:type IV secretory system conjugative DNA transfer family protein [Kordiimonas pumila]
MLRQSLDISYFARSNFRGQLKRFGIRQADRHFHSLVLGKTGTGKTTCIENLIRQDIDAFRGLALIDPHGDLAERIAAAIPPCRQQDLIYFDAGNPQQPYGYNPLRYVRPEQRPLVASGVLEVFKKMWGGSGNSWGVNMEHLLRNCILALLEVPESTFADIPRILTDTKYRAAVIPKITNQQVRTFWERDFKAGGFDRPAAIGPVLNKVGAFLSDPMLHRVLTKPETPLSFRSIMDEGKVLVVNLSKGRVGEDASSLLGSLIVSMLTIAAFSRADIPEETRRPFHLFIDEFQNFSTKSVANAASELRKQRLSLTVASQYLEGIDTDIRNAILGNAGTLISFRVGAKDAPYLAREFYPDITQEDLLNLPNYNAVVRLMIDGCPARPFGAATDGRC